MILPSSDSFSRPDVPDVAQGSSEIIIHQMPNRPRHNLYTAYCLAVVSAWTPRLPFLRSKRFWIWTVSVFSISFLSVFIGLSILGARTIDIPGVCGAALCIAIPCQTIGMIVHRWIDQRRGERRGFEVLTADEEAG